MFVLTNYIRHDIFLNIVFGIYCLALEQGSEVWFQESYRGFILREKGVKYERYETVEDSLTWYNSQFPCI